MAAIIDTRIDVTFFLAENGDTPEQTIEKVARTCYKSERRITETSAPSFVKRLRCRDHHAMLEFGYAMARIICDRGTSHELVRHRIASYAQESTRYVHLGNHGAIAMIKQPGLDIGSEAYNEWADLMDQIEETYLRLTRCYKIHPQIARSILPLALKTEIVMSANLREWRHIFDLRCSSAAHPIVRNIMLRALKIFYAKVPSVYEDLAEKYLKT